PTSDGNAVSIICEPQGTRPHRFRGSCALRCYRSRHQPALANAYPMLSRSRRELWPCWQAILQRLRGTAMIPTALYFSHPRPVNGYAVTKPPRTTRMSFSIPGPQTQVCSMPIRTLPSWLLLVALAWARPASAADWPTVHHDAQRSGLTGDCV